MYNYRQSAIMATTRYDMEMWNETLIWISFRNVERKLNLTLPLPGPRDPPPLVSPLECILLTVFGTLVAVFLIVQVRVRHETSPNRNIFRVTGPLCGEFTGHGEFPSQRPVTRIFDVFFDLRLNKRLSKQPWGWWFETPSRSLWRHCNELFTYILRTPICVDPLSLLSPCH